MDALTPADLFSPSKARQQRAQAADWAHIDSWLSSRYAGRSVPTFERTDETLKALRGLAMANERADEERTVLDRVEREAVAKLHEASMEPTRHHDDARLLHSLESSLAADGSHALDALASTAVALHTSTADPETLAHTLIEHTSTSQTLANQLSHIGALQTYLTKQNALLRTQLAELHANSAFSTPPSQQRQTTEHLRQTKHLRSKIREYEDKLSGVQSTQARGTAATPGSKMAASADAIAEMLEQHRALDELRERVERLERDVGEFAGLPADKDAARKEVGTLEVELDNARRKRDALFESLIDK